MTRLFSHRPYIKPSVDISPRLPPRAVIDARAWYGGLYENSHVITSNYATACKSPAKANASPIYPPAANPLQCICAINYDSSLAVVKVIATINRHTCLAHPAYFGTSFYHASVHSCSPKIISIQFDSCQKINSNLFIWFKSTGRPTFSYTDSYAIASKKLWY